MNSIEDIKLYIQSIGLSQGIEERVIKMTQVAYLIGQEEAYEKSREMLKEIKETI